MKKAAQQFNRRGFSSLEAIIAVSVLALAAVSVIGALSAGSASLSRAGDRATATFLAQEGVAAARSIRDEAFSDVSAGTYGVAEVDGEWSFSGSSDTQDGFTRTVAITEPSENRRHIEVDISWDGPFGGAQTLRMESDLTNWQEARGNQPGNGNGGGTGQQ